MADDFSWLLKMNELASRHGDGLKPELAKMLGARAEAQLQGAVPLPVRAASSGPAHQFATKEELDRAGIPVLRRTEQRQNRKFGEDPIELKK